MEHDSLVTMRYLNDGRLVESQCSSATRFIEAGEAVPLEGHEATYDAWMKAQGQTPVERPKPEPEPEPEEEEEPAEESEPEEAEEEEEEEDIGLPNGYRVRQYGKWRTVYGPDGKKVGKGQDTYAKAIALARDHAGL